MQRFDSKLREKNLRNANVGLYQRLKKTRKPRTRKIFKEQINARIAIIKMINPKAKDKYIK